MNLHLLLFTQFGHEGESDLIWACPLGMPFIYWPTADKEKPSPSAKNTLLPKTMITVDDGGIEESNNLNMECNGNWIWKALHATTESTKLNVQKGRKQ